MPFDKFFFFPLVEENQEFLFETTLSRNYSYTIKYPDLNKSESLQIVMSPSSSYFSVLHFQNYFQSHSEKATWNSFLEMINAFLNVCCFMLPESSSLGLACIHSLVKRCRGARFEQNTVKKRLWRLGSDRKNIHVLGKAQI